MKRLTLVPIGVNPPVLSLPDNCNSNTSSSEVQESFTQQLKDAGIKPLSEAGSGSLKGKYEMYYVYAYQFIHKKKKKSQWKIQKPSHIGDYYEFPRDNKYSSQDKASNDDRKRYDLEEELQKECDLHD